MLTVVTNVNTNHLVPNVDPVPVGVIDAFGRDDGWAGDRPADCGNFWHDRMGEASDDPAYLSSGKLTNTRGVGFFLGSIWVGGSDLAFTVEVNTTGLSSGAPIFFFMGDQRPSAQGEQLIVVLRSDVSFAERSLNAVVTDVTSGAGLPAGFDFRLYLSIRARVGGGWRVTLDASFLDGSGYSNRLTADVSTSLATVGWLSVAAAPSGVTFANLIRVA